MTLWQRQMQARLNTVPLVDAELARIRKALDACPHWDEVLSEKLKAQAQWAIKLRCDLTAGDLFAQPGRVA